MRSSAEKLFYLVLAGAIMDLLRLTPNDQQLLRFEHMVRLGREHHRRMHDHRRNLLRLSSVITLGIG